MSKKIVNFTGDDIIVDGKNITSSGIARVEVKKNNDDEKLYIRTAIPVLPPFKTVWRFGIVINGEEKHGKAIHVSQGKDLKPFLNQNPKPTQKEIEIFLGEKVEVTDKDCYPTLYVVPYEVGIYTHRPDVRVLVDGKLLRPWLIIKQE